MTLKDAVIRMGIAVAIMLPGLQACSPPPRQERPSHSTGRESPATTVSVPPMTPELQSFVATDNGYEYVIGPGDVLKITLREVEITTEKVTVRPDGYISFSLAEDVQAAGRTAAQVDAGLTSVLSHFLRHPKIDVEVAEYKSKQVSILGAVQAVVTAGVKTGPGRYPLHGRSTVLDLILEAGGTTPDAQLDQVQLLREGQAYLLDIQRVLRTGDPSQNPVLQARDIIIVPGAARLTKKVVVLGEVTSPDVYLLGENARLLEALGKAGGLTRNALRDDIRIIRAGQNGPRMYSANFERLAERGDLGQNLALENNDLVYVPRSFLGDVNDVIAKIQPLLDIMLLPATYRDLYTTGGGLRLDTGKAGNTSGTVYTRPLPGTAKPTGDAETGKQKEQTGKEAR